MNVMPAGFFDSAISLWHMLVSNLYICIDLSKSSHIRLDGSQTVIYRVFLKDCWRIHQCYSSCKMIPWVSGLMSNKYFYNIEGNWTTIDWHHCQMICFSSRLYFSNCMLLLSAWTKAYFLHLQTSRPGTSEETWSRTCSLAYWLPSATCKYCTRLWKLMYWN